MSYKVTDARAKMKELIDGLKHVYNELYELSWDSNYSPSERGEFLFLMAKINTEIDHRLTIAAFDAASKQVIRAPTDEETRHLQETLTALGKQLDAFNNFKAVVNFTEAVMTETAVSFADLMETIT